MLNSTTLRPEYVTNAVKFLVTVGVHDGTADEVSNEQKTKFLTEKGLTPHEIREAQRRAAMLKPTQQDRDDAVQAQGEAQSSSSGSTNTATTSPSTTSAEKQTPTVVYVNPPPPTSLAANGTEDKSWSSFFSTGILSAMLTVGISSFARQLEWTRHLLDPGLKTREEEEKRQRDAVATQLEAQKVQIEATQALVREKQSSMSQATSGSRSLELQGLRREVELLQRSMQRQAVDSREEVRQLQAEVRELRRLARSESSTLNISADIRSDLAAIKTLMIASSPVRRLSASRLSVSMDGDSVQRIPADLANSSADHTNTLPDFSNASPITATSRSLENTKASNKIHNAHTPAREISTEGNIESKPSDDAEPSISNLTTPPVPSQVPIHHIASQENEHSDALDRRPDEQMSNHRREDELREAMTTIFNTNDFETFRKGHKTLLLILHNLKKEPSNPRYAKIAMSNPTFNEALFAPIKNIDKLFTALEFQKNQTTWYWKPEDQLKSVELLAEAISYIKAFVSDERKLPGSSSEETVGRDPMNVGKSSSATLPQSNTSAQNAGIQSLDMKNTSNPQPIIPVQNEENIQPQSTQLSLAEVMEAHRQGLPLPGIRTIPDTLTEHPSSTSFQSPPEKPWSKKNELSQVRNHVSTENRGKITSVQNPSNASTSHANSTKESNTTNTQSNKSTEESSKTGLSHKEPAADTATVSDLD